ncbi:MAG: Flp pilus assembly protein CpaB [Massilia sp.]
MKNKRAVAMLALAVLFGLAAVVLASRWLLVQSASGANKIVVAASDVNIGQRLGADMLTLAEWPLASRPQGAFSDPAKLAGRVLKSSILRGEPFSEAKLAPGGTVGGLSALITEGKRAITVRVNDVIGVAGFALPGNYVDIIVSTRKDAAPGDRNGQEQNIAKIVLERILVLAVAQEVNRDDTKPRVVNAVTLEVSPEQAEKLDLARSVGTLSLALRNQVDPQDTKTTGATKLTLLDEPAPPPRAAPPAKPVTARAPVVHRVAAEVRRNCVGVLNGVHASQECF